MTLTINIGYEDANGDWCDKDVTIPVIYEVCPRCQGSGRHDHPAFGNGISPAEFHEDPDFAEDYFRGVYDVVCEECRGLRVVSTPDWDRMPDPLRADVTRHYQGEAEYKREQEHRQRLRDRGIEY